MIETPKGVGLKSLSEENVKLKKEIEDLRKLVEIQNGKIDALNKGINDILNN